MNPDDWSLPGPELLRKLDHFPAPIDLEIEVLRHNRATLESWIARRKRAIIALTEHISEMEKGKAQVEEALARAEECQLRSQPGN
jgi:hypothetical protein